MKLADMRKERDYLKTLSEGVMRNSEVYRERMKAAEQERDAHKAQIADLEDQVRLQCLDERHTLQEWLSSLGGYDLPPAMREFLPIAFEAEIHFHEGMSCSRKGHRLAILEGRRS